MVQVLDDVDRGKWLRERVRGWARVESVAGHGAEAYLAALVPLLRQATTSPDDAVAGFWAGGSGQKLVSSQQLELPGRDHVLATTSLTELADPDWGFSLDLGWAPGLRISSLQLLWPEDHAWVLASEIDWDSTIVAGSRALIDSILGDGRFEAFEVGPDDDLSWDGDVVNVP